MKHQQGFLMLIAAFMIIIGSFVAMTVANIINNSATATTRHLDTEQAFYIANAGLDKALYLLTTKAPNTQISCDDITGNNELTNVTFDSGQFTVTATSSGVYSAMLASTINASTTIIPVTSLSGYTRAGRVMIGKEAIDYTHSSTSLSDCAGNEPCLLGVTRGAGGSLAVPHSSGERIVQNTCTLFSTSNVPSFNNPVAIREVDEYAFGYGSFNEGLASGKKISDNAENIISLSTGTWSTVGPNANIANKDLNSIERLNGADSWIVGQKDSGQGTIIHWDGSTWTQFTPILSGNECEAGGGKKDKCEITPDIDKDFNAISCINSQDCHLVGDDGALFSWNGSVWSSDKFDKDLPDKDLTGVYCIAADDCWAVGKKDKEALFVHWDGTEWTQVDGEKSVEKQDLNDITCTASNSCWAVGKKHSFAYWNGSTWDGVDPDSSVPDKTMNAITCNSSSDCWTVGDDEGKGKDAVIAHWNGNTWSRVLPDSSVTDKKLEAVSCEDSNYCYATGEGGTMIYWNGTIWQDANANLANKENRAIAIAKSYSKTITNWDET